jgi:hypothetical protein
LHHRKYFAKLISLQFSIEKKGNESPAQTKDQKCNEKLILKSQKNEKKTNQQQKF